jgi:hypothetical protein
LTLLLLAALAVSELPECLTWLWSNYDPKKAEQTFEQRRRPSRCSGFASAIVQRIILPIESR